MCSVVDNCECMHFYWMDTGLSRNPDLAALVDLDRITLSAKVTLDAFALWVAPAIVKTWIGTRGSR